MRVRPEEYKALSNGLRVQLDRVSEPIRLVLG